jgi:hypothetical protein
VTSRGGRRRASRRRGGGVRASRAAFLLVLVLFVAGACVVGWQSTSAPDLGAAPRGPNDGTTRLEIAATMGRRAAQGLALAPHTVVTLSEQDLSTVLRSSNPDAQQFQDPEARVRDGLVVIDVRTSLGPVGIIAVARVALSLVCPADGAPDVAADVRGISAGRMPLPGFAVSQIRDRISRDIDLHGLLADAQLDPIRPYLDSVAVTGQGVALGFHRPGLLQGQDACSPS